MSSISKTKIKILVVGIIVSTVYMVFIFNNQQKIESSLPQTSETKYPSESTIEKTPAEAAKPTLTATPKNSHQKIPEAIPPAPLSDQDPFSPQNSTQRDSEQFREVTEQTNIKIRAQMRQEEITSLKASITNDKALLKKIEDSGTGIEDYKFIEQNLKKRIQRLKSLSQ
jgi:hypothetical protein